MNSCRKYQESFLEALYGELEPPQSEAFERHLAACPICSKEFDGLKETLQLLQARKRPQPDEAFWTMVWARFLREVESNPSSATKNSGWFLQPRWVWRTAAAAALVLLGFAFGRYFTDRPMEISDRDKSLPAAPSGLHDALDERVDRYLQRSKLVLLGVVNLDPNHQDISSFDLTPERTLSRELVQETYSLKQELAAARQKRMLELLSELEVILLQISHLQEGHNALGIELAKTGIRHKALVFKINVEEMSRARPSNSGESSKVPGRS
jgi:Putative zinc-finger